MLFHVFYVLAYHFILSFFISSVEEKVEMVGFQDSSDIFKQAGNFVKSL